MRKGTSRRTSSIIRDDQSHVTTECPVYSGHSVVMFFVSQATDRIVVFFRLLYMFECKTIAHTTFRTLYEMFFSQNILGNTYQTTHLAEVIHLFDSSFTLQTHRTRNDRSMKRLCR
jgi:hypothetical protein